MPLSKSKSPEAFKTNVSEMIRSGHPRDQALAASYRVQRGKKGGGRIDEPIRFMPGRDNEPHHFDEIAEIAHPSADSSMGKGAHFAPGGSVASPPWFVRNEARSMGHQGFIGSTVPGRTDRHHMSVAGGAYVIPSDVISSAGEGNSLAGAAKFNALLKLGPYGSGASHISAPKAPKMIRQKFSDGGETNGDPTEIVTAGGEYVVPPHAVQALGSGSLDHGHNILDAMVHHVRKQTIKKLKSLPGPKTK